MSIIEFLLARIAEDEEGVRNARLDGDEAPSEWWMPDCWTRTRGVAECEAKRRIVAAYPARQRWIEDHRLCEEPTLTPAGWDIPPALLILADVYAEHPDYDRSWRP